MLLKAFFDILFPPLCHGCKSFIPDAGELHLCPACLAGSPAIDSPLCTVCGLPFATEGGIDHCCGGCHEEPPPFAAARAAVVFDGPVRELVHRFKYGKKVQHSRPLGLLAARQLDEFAAASEADLLIPVPLHVKRLRQRGFNQAVLLGEILAKRWRLPLSRNDLRRIRWTEPQINLSAAQRQGNVRGAFAVHDPAAVRDRRIILVDDVYTTGSTVAECARTLKKAGAEAVFVVTVARAMS
ncbi:MAG TPA: ComF family protein [Geobacteraceae bacterium]